MGKIKVVSQKEAEKVCYVVCGFDRHQDDDIETVCVLCCKAIVHRPYAPKKPKKICLDCAIKTGLLKGQFGNVCVTKKVVEEVKKFIKQGEENGG